MKPKSTILVTTLFAIVIVLSSVKSDYSSAQQQQFPETNRKDACGCFCGGSTPDYFLFGNKDCAGILTAELCGQHVSSLPPERRQQVCAKLKAANATCPLAKKILESCGADGGGDKGDDCPKPAPWFDASSSSGCKDVQDTEITIDQRTQTGTVSMCGVAVLRVVSENFGAKADPLFRDVYTKVFKEQTFPKKICCDKFREAARTGVPCNPTVDLDCDGIPNQEDLVKQSEFPAIDLYTLAENSDVDLFPQGFDVFDPNFQPNGAARNAKGVGDCPCKWELIKGDLKCNGAVNNAGERQHVYTATWRCPKTKAEVFTTKYAPTTAPCP
jgi:hypothetical protein